MFWWMLARILSFLLNLAASRRQSDQEKDAQILLLRHQLRVLAAQASPPTTSVSLGEASPGSLGRQA